MVSDAEVLGRYMDQLPAGVLALRGPSHVVVAANGAARRLLGERDGVLGRAFREVAPEVVGQQLFEALDEVYASGEATSGHEWRMLLAEGGTGELEEVFLNFTVVAVRERDGVVSGVLMHFADVTVNVRRRREVEATAAELGQRYRVTREAVLGLQRRLLPVGLPVLPGVGLAAHYLVASAEQAAGGDWFDALPVAGGQVALVVGDVVGHGPEASAVMGQLRVVLAEFLLDEPDLAVALARLDRFSSRITDAHGATVCVALRDPAVGSLRYACAGHPPPLVVAEDGASRFLLAPGGGPLGLAGVAPRVAKTTLRPGELLLCYSDGLVERVGHSPEARQSELAAAAAAALLRGTRAMMTGDAADRVAALTVERMTREGYADDVTLLVAQRTGRIPAPFVADVPAQDEQLPELRAWLDQWLHGIGASDPDIHSIVLAVCEAMSNVIDHAYPTQAGHVRIEGILSTDGRVCMNVIDGGTWRTAPSDPGFRGRGLMMMRGCMDSVEIDTRGEGTILLLDRRLIKTFELSGIDKPVTGHRPNPTSLTIGIELSDEPHVTVAGPIDATTVDQLSTALRRANRGGALSLRVELSGVTHLASVGVHLFYDLLDEMHTDGRRLRLIAPANSPARFALKVSGFDDLTAVSDT